jgi:hypothetical protein
MVDVWKESQFLSAEDANGHNPISVEDFLNYVRHDTEDTNVSFFSNNMVDWSLNLLRERPKIKASSKIAIVSTYFASRLYRMGIGLDADGEFAGLRGESGYPFYDGHEELPVYMFRGKAVTPSDFQTLQDLHPISLAELTGKQYVLIPVNNGYTSVAQTGSAGAHWSFIVVDTLKKVARYIDSLAIPQMSERKRFRITNIQINGAVAGKVLCGFEIFMKYRKGVFTTSTIKWLPHQHTEGEILGHPDYGACGPYVYALMKYILTNQELLVKGLKESFTMAKKQEYLQEICFNSKTSRNEIQAELWNLRTTKESRNPVIHPMNLNPGTPTRTGNLLLVLSVDVLELMLAPNFLRSVYRASTPEQRQSMLNPGVLRAVLTRDFLVSVLIAHERTQENYRDEINAYGKGPRDDNHDDSGDDEDDDSDTDIIFNHQLKSSAALQKEIENLRRLIEMTPDELNGPDSAAEAAGLLPERMTKEKFVTKVAKLEKVLAARVASLAEHRRNNARQLRAQIKYFKDTEAYTPRQRFQELRNGQTRGQHVGKTRKQFYRWVARNKSELEEVLKTREVDDGTISTDNLRTRITSFQNVEDMAPEYLPDVLKTYRALGWLVQSEINDANLLQWLITTRATYEKWLADRVVAGTKVSEVEIAAVGTGVSEAEVERATGAKKATKATNATKVTKETKATTATKSTRVTRARRY